MGFSSRTLWAAQNIGATYEYQARKVFRMGRYSWVCVSVLVPIIVSKVMKVASSMLEKVTLGCFTKYDQWNDYTTTLRNSDDAAYVNMGSGWHLPTSAQTKEFSDNTTSSSVTNYQRKWNCWNLIYQQEKRSKDILSKVWIL